MKKKSDSFLLSSPLGIVGGTKYEPGGENAFSGSLSTINIKVFPNHDIYSFKRKSGKISGEGWSSKGLNMRRYRNMRGCIGFYL